LDFFSTLLETYVFGLAVGDLVQAKVIVESIHCSYTYNLDGFACIEDNNRARRPPSHNSNRGMHIFGVGAILD